jgi:hypothetical protein
MNLKLNELHRDYIEVYDAAESPVTGLEQADFGVVLLVNGSLSSKSVTIEEVNPSTSPGVYEVSFTPDTLGEWYLLVTQATYQKTGWKDIYQVFTADIDDVYERVGDGSNQVTITVQDQDTSNPVIGALVEVYNESLTARVAFGETNASGVKVFWLNDGNYKVTVKKFGYYMFDNPFDLVVAVDTPLTIEGEAFAPSPPWSPDLCTVYGWVVSNGQPQEVTVKARLLNDAYYLDNKQIDIVTDQTVASRSSDGYWELPLTRTTDSMNDDLRYEFTVGETPLGVFNIPDQDSISLKELAEDQQDED